MVRKGEKKTVKQENNNYKIIKMVPANCAAFIRFNSSVLVSIPPLAKTVFNHLPIVHGFTDL